MGIDKRGFFTDEGDIRMSENTLHPTPQLRNDLSHPLTGFLEGGTMHVSLRGDAAHIEAGAAHLASLEDGDLQSLLSSIFSGAVTSRSRADDD